jgi:heterotetrameric sarcosine oxidase delta subunit
MRIPCPHCGSRSHEEFAYLGDAMLGKRPEAPPPDPASGEDDEALRRAFCDYVYLRDNPPGRHHELWFHASGCQEWLVVERDISTHRVFSAQSVRNAGAGA